MHTPLSPRLLPDEVAKLLPPLYASEEIDDPIARVKFFTPDGSWTWYAIEFDGDDTFFGDVVGDFPELGYFSLSELQEIRGQLGLPVERDLYFRADATFKAPVGQPWGGGNAAPSYDLRQAVRSTLAEPI